MKTKVILKGEKELRNYIAQIESEIERKINSIQFVPKDNKSVEVFLKQKEFIELIINFLNELLKKRNELIIDNNFKENIVKELQQKIEEKLKKLKDDLDSDPKLEEFIKELKKEINYNEEIFLIFLNSKFEELINYYNLGFKYIIENLTVLNNIKISKKGLIDSEAIRRQKAFFRQELQDLEKSIENIEKLINEKGGVLTKPTSQIIEYLLTVNLKEKKVLYNEDFEAEPYEIKLIPFIKVLSVQYSEVEEGFVVSKIETIYGVVSNKYILIKRFSIRRGKEIIRQEKVIVNLKTTNIISFNNKFLAIVFQQNENGELEEYVMELPKEVEIISQLLKKISIIENEYNSKVGFYFKKGKLKANYVRGYGKVKHESVEFDLGSPISLLYTDGKSEVFFYDYYTFKGTNKYFDEMPTLYKETLKIFDKLRERNSEYLYPFIITIGFTFSSIFIEVFKKNLALFPGIYFYGLQGTGKSLLLKLSRIFLGIKDNRVCDSLAQARDLLSSVNNIAYLDELPVNFDKTKTLKEVLKNLMTNVETTHQLSGRDGAIFTMRGTIFITTNEPIENTFGSDEALEQRLIFVNFNYDNKVSRDIAEKIAQITQNIKFSLAPNETGETPLSYAIFLMYSLIKKNLNDEKIISDLVLKYYKKVESIVINKGVNDISRFATLITAIYFGLYIFSQIVEDNRILNFFEENINNIIDYILEEHPSYRMSIKDFLYKEFVIKTSNFINMLEINLIDVVFTEKDDALVINDERLKKNIKSRLQSSDYENLVVIYEINGSYYALIQDQFIKKFFKEYKEYYNFKNLKELKTFLENIGIKEVGKKRVRKRILYMFPEVNEIKVEIDHNPLNIIQMKLYKIPRFIVEELENKIIMSVEGKSIKKVHVELKQKTLKEFMNLMKKVVEDIKEEEAKKDDEEEFSETQINDIDSL